TTSATSTTSTAPTTTTSPPSTPTTTTPPTSSTLASLPQASPQADPPGPKFECTGAESFLTHGKQGSSSSNSAQGPAELFSSTLEPGRLEFTQVGPKFNGLYNAMGFDPNYETTQGGYLFLIGWVWNTSNTLKGALLQMGSDGIPFNTGTITG